MPDSPRSTTDPVIQQLIEREAELTKRLEKIGADRRHANKPLEADWDDRAIELENDEVLDALDEREREELTAIRAALHRVDAGCYGICDDCGQDIDPLRLEALPSAERCIACEEAAEAGR
jgi:RNA polymerase-binding transcription factor DksA